MNRCMDDKCGHVNSAYTMSHHSSTTLKATSTKQHGRAAAGSGSKANSMTQRGSVTWDITLSRPIQHCEEHNRQGWPFTHGCRSAGQLTVRHHAEQQDKHNGLYRGLAGDWWLRLHGSLLLRVHTVLHFMNINFMFT